MFYVKVYVKRIGFFYCIAQFAIAGRFNKIL